MPRKNPFAEEVSDEECEAEKQRREAAIAVLNKFISNYSPVATFEEADTFLSTSEISKAIGDHAGYGLTTADIFEVMNNMGYKYQPLNGQEFNWLLKKED